MQRTTQSYVLAMAKAQGKISRLLLYYGEGDEKFKQLHTLIAEIEELKQTFLKDDPQLASHIKNIKTTRPFYTGLTYLDPFGWGNQTPPGGWPASKAGMMYYNEDHTDQKKLPFGLTRVKNVPKRGESLPFEDIWKPASKSTTKKK